VITRKLSLPRRLSWFKETDAQSDRLSVDQHLYWNKIAAIYDHFYSDRWSQLEDRLVCKRLKNIAYNPAGIVLDLACGTGHGYELLRYSLDISEYHGVDTSQAMLAELAAKYPELQAIHGTMDDLSCLPSDHYSLATVFYSSASYSNDPKRLLAEIYRLLEPGGHAYYSVLNRTSLRRIFSAKRGPLEHYRTRGDTATSSGVPAVALTRRQIRSAARAAGFQVMSLHGLGALAGVFQHPIAWLPSRLMDVSVPFLSHTQELIARKAN